MTVTYSSNFSLPIAFTYMVHQNFPLSNISCLRYLLLYNIIILHKNILHTCVNNYNMHCLWLGLKIVQTFQFSFVKNSSGKNRLSHTDTNLSIKYPHFSILFLLPKLALWLIYQAKNYSAFLGKFLWITASNIKP